MKKAYTIIDVLIIVVILAILAAVVVPAYNKVVRRSELKEVRTLVELTRAGAKYYHGKYWITSITTPANLSVLNVTVPSDAKCTYSIVSGAGNTRILEVRRTSDNVLLYTYQLPNGPGVVQATTDARYLEDLPT